jgi:hypothetical protein
MSLIKQEDAQRMEELLKDCPKGIKIGKPELGIPCKTKEMGLESFFECLEKNPYTCRSHLRFGDLYLCRCPVRIAIAKELKM